MYMFGLGERDRLADHYGTFKAVDRESMLNLKGYEVKAQDRRKLWKSEWVVSRSKQGSGRSSRRDCLRKATKRIVVARNSKQLKSIS